MASLGRVEEREIGNGDKPMTYRYRQRSGADVIIGKVYPVLEEKAGFAGLAKDL
jgi:hypothetical protein